MFVLLYYSIKATDDNDLYERPPLMDPLEATYYASTNNTIEFLVSIRIPYCPYQKGMVWWSLGGGCGGGDGLGGLSKESCSH